MRKDALRREMAASIAVDVAPRAACAALKKEASVFQPQWSSSLHSAATQAREFCWDASEVRAPAMRHPRLLRPILPSLLPPIAPRIL